MSPTSYLAAPPRVASLIIRSTRRESTAPYARGDLLLRGVYSVTFRSFLTNSRRGENRNVSKRLQPQETAVSRNDHVGPCCQGRLKDTAVRGILRDPLVRQVQPGGGYWLGAETRRVFRA